MKYKKYKATITNEIKDKTWVDYYDTEAEAQAWINHNINKNGYPRGKPARQTWESELEDYEVSRVTASVSTERTPGVWENLCTLPADYSTATTPNNSAGLEEVRSQRNMFLSDTDWITCSDFQGTTACQNLFETYRQSLRDLPAQVGFDPFDFSWPVIPTYVKK